MLEYAPMNAEEKSLAISKAMQARLDKSQWYAPERLQSDQLARLRALVRFARAYTPFYENRLAGLPDEFSWAEWRRLPVLTRAVLQENRSALNSVAVPKSHGRIRVARSSGSTGRPVEVKVPFRHSLLSRALTLRTSLWHGRDFSKSVAVIRRTHDPETNIPTGKRLPRWGDFVTYPFETGPMWVLSIDASANEQLAWLHERDPEYLVTYPSNLANLLRASALGGGVPKALKQIETYGETLNDDTAEMCRALWSVPVVDGYSAEETGPIAYQCPSHAGYHVHAEQMLVEIIKANGAVAEPGETGLITVTPLHNYATPLLRYQLGDLAEAGGPCLCGRGLPHLNKILGRVRNALVLRTGARYWPAFGTRSLIALAPIRQHQFIQRDFDTIEARFVAARPLTAEECDAIRDHVQNRLPAPFRIEIEEVAEIPRAPSGKFEDFRSEIADV